LQPFLERNKKMPKKKNEYQIEFGGLKAGWHNFEFDIEKTFFDQISEEEEIENFQLHADCKLEKQSTLLVLEVKLTGFLSLSCDRCLIDYQHPVEIEERVVVKFASVTEQINTEELIEIPFGAHNLNLQQFFYEMILLSLPMKRVRPDCKNSAATCDIEVLNKLADFKTEEEEIKSKETDQKWAALKNIKFNPN
jgi:uncharacterized protein